MTDLSTTIEPKSDQLNSDDLISGPITIRITKVSANPSSAEQPISVYFEGDQGKPYKPCKSMRRVLVNTWGSDGSRYVGRSMMLYRDPSVRFGGLEVGGTRISHMSDIEKPITMALTASRANRKPFTVQPLVVATSQPVDLTGDIELGDTAASGGMNVLGMFWKALGGTKQQLLKDRLDAWKKRASEVDKITADAEFGTGAAT